MGRNILVPFSFEPTCAGGGVIGHLVVGGTKALGGAQVGCWGPLAVGGPLTGGLEPLAVGGPLTGGMGPLPGEGSTAGDTGGARHFGAVVCST